MVPNNIKYDVPSDLKSTGGLSASNKINPASRIALAGNDPLLQAIALNKRPV
jgi:hypothetical protein